MKIISLLLLLPCFALISCQQSQAGKEPEDQAATDSAFAVIHPEEQEFPEEEPISDLSEFGDAVEIGELEKSLIEAGLVDIQTVESSIQVELKYATADNFLGKNVYGTLRNCYLQPIVADMLATAQRNLQAEHPHLSLLVYDGVRPRSVQYKMWDIVKGTDQQEYVASPKAGSMHNYGASVDLTLATTEGVALDMGTPFDFFGPQAQPRFEEKYIQSGELTTQQVKNRRILRASMQSAGFHIILNEWWHFNAFARDTIKARFTAVE